MKKFILYLFFLTTSFSGFAGVIEVDITGKTCFHPELEGNTFEYQGEIVDSPFLCTIDWAYLVVGGQIISSTNSDGITTIFPPGTSGHAREFNDVDQVTVEWFSDEICKSIKFKAWQSGPLCFNNEDSKTLIVQTAPNCNGLGSPISVVNLNDTYCCKKDVILNTEGTMGEDRYMISICQLDTPGGPCINWRSTDWVEGEVDLNVDLLKIWNNNGASNWIFWPNYSYKVSLALQNNCVGWESVSKTFEVVSIDPSFVINDANGIHVPDNQSVCIEDREVTMDATSSSCGDEYMIMICQIDPDGGECLNWRSTGWIEGNVSNENSIDLLSIWNKNGTSSWLFWSGHTFRVSLVLRDKCDTWEGYNQTFTVQGDCFNGGGNDKGLKGDFEDFKNNTQQIKANNKIKIYPTQVNSSVPHLTVVVPELKANSTLFIYDVQGKIIQHNQINDTSSDILIPENIEAGLYFVVIFEEGKPIHQSKFIFSN